MPELPETLEDIVVWALEHAQVKRYLHHVQMTNFACRAGLTARELVLEWLVRIWPLGVVTSDYAWSGIHTYNGEPSDYYRVSVAGIAIGAVTQREYNEIRGETHARTP
jgi:hypothetical protein